MQLQHHEHSWACETGPRARTWAGSHSPEPWGQGSQRPQVRLGQHQAARSLWRAKPEVSSGPAGSEEEEEEEETRRVSAASTGTRPGQGGAQPVGLVGEAFCQDSARPPGRPRPGTSHPYNPGQRPDLVKEMAHCGWRGQGRLEWAGKKEKGVPSDGHSRNRAFDKDPEHGHFLRPLVYGKRRKFQNRV